MKKTKKNKKLNITFSKPLFVFFLIVVITLIITYIVNKNGVIDYSSLKKDTEKSYIYTYKENKKSRSYIPKINIFSKDAETINNKIETESKLYLESTTPNISVSYKYNMHKNILSIVLTYKIINKKDELEYLYNTYVFDLAQDGKLLTNQEILNMYNITEVGIDNKIKKKLYEVYNDEIEKNIINKNECNYECFLKLRGTTNFANGANYYIENGHLVVYRSFDVYSKYKEEEYFTRDNFKFIIK